MQQNCSGFRLTAWTSSCFDRTQKPLSWLPANPSGNGLPPHGFLMSQAGKDLVREAVGVQGALSEIDPQRFSVHGLDHRTSR